MFAHVAWAADEREATMLEIIKNEKLKKVLDDRGLKDCWVAKKAGIDIAYFSRIKTGRMIPTPGQRKDIAAVLQVSVLDIFS